MRSSVLLLLPCCLMLVTRPGAAQRAGDGPVDLRCPAAGTVVSHWSGPPIRHAGAHPNDPAVCLRRSAGGMEEWLYQIFRLDRPREGESVPQTARERESRIREGMARLRPLERGRVVTFTYPERSGSTGSTSLYRETWTVEDKEDLSLDGGTHSTVRIARLRETLFDPNAAFLWRYWFDVATGALLRTSVEVRRGVLTADPPPADSSSRAITLSVPAP
jgi:hypothetical protein